MAPQLLQHLPADAHWSPRYKRTAWMTLGPVLVVGLLVPVSAAEPVFKQLEALATDQPVQLEYHFRSGERINTEVAHRALTETTIGGTTQSTDTATDSTKTWLVVSVDSEGRATLEHSVDGVTMTSRTSDRGQVRWSSRDNQPPPPGYEGV